MFIALSYCLEPFVNSTLAETRDKQSFIIEQVRLWNHDCGGEILILINGAQLVSRH